jgi:hypothetical protein
VLFAEGVDDPNAADSAEGSVTSGNVGNAALPHDGCDPAVVNEIALDGCNLPAGVLEDLQMPDCGINANDLRTGQQVSNVCVMMRRNPISQRLKQC